MQRIKEDERCARFEVASESLSVAMAAVQFPVDNSARCLLSASARKPLGNKHTVPEIGKKQIARSCDLKSHIVTGASPSISG